MPHLTGNSNFSFALARMPIASVQSTRVVIWIAAVTMVIEIIAGWRFNSMALLADSFPSVASCYLES